MWRRTLMMQTMERSVFFVIPINWFARFSIFAIAHRMIYRHQQQQQTATTTKKQQRTKYKKKRNIQQHDEIIIICDLEARHHDVSALAPHCLVRKRLCIALWQTNNVFVVRIK